MKTENKELLKAFSAIFAGLLLYSLPPLVTYIANPPKKVETVTLKENIYGRTKARLAIYENAKVLVVREGSTNISLVDLDSDENLDYKRITSYARQGGGAIITPKPSLEDQILYEAVLNNMQVRIQ